MGSEVAAEEQMLERIRTAAEKTLVAWPEAEAAVLFGSRARGDHSADSDWDVAFITQTGERVRPIPRGLPIEALPCQVQCLALPDELAGRKALAIGHVGRAVVNDGRILAGRWRRPEASGLPRIEPDDYRKAISMVVVHMGNAATRLAEIDLDPDPAGAGDLCDSFAVESADAAEHLVKAMLGRAGIEHGKIHDVGGLADQAHAAGDTELATVIRSMNGTTPGDHLALYGSEVMAADGCRHAANRMLTTVEVLEAELCNEASKMLSSGDVRGRMSVAARVADQGRRLLTASMQRNFVPAGSDFDRQRTEALTDLRPAIAVALGSLSERLTELLSAPA